MKFVIVVKKIPNNGKSSLRRSNDEGTTNVIPS